MLVWLIDGCVEGTQEDMSAIRTFSPLDLAKIDTRDQFPRYRLGYRYRSTIQGIPRTVLYG